MHTLKHGLERPLLIWFLIAGTYISVFWGPTHELSLSGQEQTVLGLLEPFSQGAFFPKIDLIRSLPDWGWGHLGYYVLMGRVFKLGLVALRFSGLVLVLASLFVFIFLGKHFTYHNRLSPIWISFAMMILAFNPNLWPLSHEPSYVSLLLFLLLSAFYFFEKQNLNLSSVLVSLAILVDWQAGLLALCFVLCRLKQSQDKILRPERALALLFPFFVASFPLFTWKDILPQGDAQDWWDLLRRSTSSFHVEGLSYFLALLPIYGFFYTWVWGIRARARALNMGAIITLVCAPFYFLFPLKSDLQVSLGWVDTLAQMAVGSYKGLLLFIPWLVGVFLFIQLILMDILDQSRGLRYFIVLFFVAWFFACGYGDSAFLLVLPFILLLSLSEALVGEEGKLA